MADTKLVVLSARHRPFEVSLMAVSFFIGVRGLFTVNPQGILYQTIGAWSDLWSVGLILGPGLCLVSLFLKLPDNLLWERVGICLLVTVFFSYFVTGIIITGELGFNYAFLAMIVCIGGVGRVIQITSDLKHIREAIDKTNGGSNGLR